MKLSAIFREAKHNLAMNPAEERAGKSEFICHAIERLQVKRVFSAIRVIEDRLAGHGTVSRWLECGAKADPQEVYRKPSDRDYGLCVPKVQKFRAAWLDSLAAEFEAKGD